MDETPETTGSDEYHKEAQPPRPRRRAIIAATVAVLVIGVLFVVIEKRKAHLERLDRTHEIAQNVVAAVEDRLRSVDPFTASEQAKLRTFRNKEHVAAAERLGIAALETASEAKRLSRRNELVRITDSAYYTIQDLDYSVPYLVPSGSVLLDEIGRQFHERLAEIGLPPFQFVVTSVTRTRDDQKALRRVNVNAAAKSSHEYGTTFDLHYGKFAFSSQAAIPDSSNIYEDVLREGLTAAYRRFSKQYDGALKALLGRELIELQEGGSAMAIYERRQPVFHVTVAEELAAQDSDVPTVSSRK